MAKESSSPLPVPSEKKRITVGTTGNVMGDLKHEEAAAGDQRALYTEGISSCKVLATYTPGGARTLLHANGGEFTDAYLESLVKDHINPDTTVVIANGNGAGSRDLFENEVTEVEVRLKVYLKNYGKEAVKVVPSWSDTESGNSTTFVLRHDGTYGRCDIKDAGVGGGGKKKWYLCGCCCRARSSPAGAGMGKGRKKKWYFCWCC